MRRGFLHIEEDAAHASGAYNTGETLAVAFTVDPAQFSFTGTVTASLAFWKDSGATNAPIWKLRYDTTSPLAAGGTLLVSMTGVTAIGAQVVTGTFAASLLPTTVYILKIIITAAAGSGNYHSVSLVLQ